MSRCRSIALAAALPALAAATAAAGPADVLYAVPGVGDGAVTRADVDALCEFTVWGFNLLLEDAGEEGRLDASANPRIVRFFSEAWPWLDADVQAFVANAAQTAPALKASATGTDADATVDAFLEFSDRVWAGTEDVTVAFFAGLLDEASYGAAWAASRGIAPDGGAPGAPGQAPGGSFEDQASRFGYEPPPIQYDGDILVDDATGNVISGE